METTIKVYVIGPQIGYARPIFNKEFVSNIEDADVVVLTGGVDIDPSIYGKKRHSSVWSSPQRDAFEIAEYKRVRKDQVVYGVCRGAQLLCALNGGLLVQDVSNHAIGQMHLIKGVPGTEFENERMYITSLHHQMMYPYTMPASDYTNLFIASPARSLYYEGDGIDPQPILDNGEPEITLFHKENCPMGLAVQGHPEMMNFDSEAVVFVNNMLRNLLKKVKGC